MADRKHTVTTRATLAWPEFRPSRVNEYCRLCIQTASLRPLRTHEAPILAAGWRFVMAAGIVRLLSISSFALVVSGCATIGAGRASDVYHGFTLLDPVSERRIEDAYIVVRNGRIDRIGAGRLPRSIPAERRHDMGGGFALPGLVDTHAHIALGRLTVAMSNGAPQLGASSESEITTHNARMMVAHGVTTVRNPGGDAEANIAYRRRVRDREWVGPDAYSAGEVLDATLPIRGLSTIVTDAASIEAEVARQASLGVDYIKLYQSLSEAQIAAGVAAAHARGLPTILHGGDVSWARAAELGVDSLVHAMPVSPDLLGGEARQGYAPRGGAYTFFEWWERADLGSPEMQAMIAELAEREVSVDLTLVVFQKAFWGNDPSVRDAGLEFAHPLMVQNWNTLFRFDLGWSGENYRRAQAVWPKMLRFARMLYDAGVRLTIGDDFANPFVAPGADMHAEMRLYQEAGIPPWAILRMATSGGAASMGLDHQIGRLERGFEADVVFLNADPSRDIANVSAMRGVLLDGRYFDPAALRVPDARGGQ